MKTNEIRQSFLDFFESKNHKVVSSSALVPNNDETLLFTNAGMVQFKDVFLGTDKKSYKRASTSQRCIRAGGKHNDLENVGYTLRHHTFFEMLGNFSFGDYFKEEAIEFAWEFLTEVLKLDKDKLWITVYKDDDEAEEIWKNKIGIDPKRIARLGDEDNFWSMGDTGPCGPCSEIFYDHGDHIEGTPPGADGDEGDRFIEIWNLVFMQFNRDESGDMEPLPKPSVDTGMGLERIAAVMQGVNSNYETDIFKDLIIASEKILGDKGSTSHKVIADHIRSSVFLISDGVIPEKEGRGYVLRRIMRRGIRHGYKIGATKPFLHLLVKDLISLMKQAYPELEDNYKNIVKIIKNEETKFFETLQNGIEILEETISTMQNKTISGEIVFKLHDTYGFPFDLTADIAREKQLLIDEHGFNKCMKQQKESSKSSSHFVSSLPAASGVEETKFLGYDQLESESEILVIWDGQERVENALKGQEIFLACNQTPFYAESGGQIGDIGFIESNDGDVVHIHDTIKEGSLSIHLTKNLPKKLDLIFRAVVDSKNRFRIQCNHTATHLLHQALRNILGNHVEQKGSRVSSENFRFDFSHYSKLDQSDIISVENFVNSRIENSIDLIEERNVPLKKAQDNGAIGLFGEKYGDTVRTIKFGASYELCGGTHVNNTSELWQFKIISEGAIASGIRRIEAITNESVKNYYNSKINEYDKIKDILKNPKSLYESIKSLSEENSLLKKEIDKLSNEKVFSVKKDIITKLENISGLNVITTTVDLKPAKIKDLCFSIASEIENLFLIIITKDLNKVYCSCYISKNLVSEKNLNSSEIISKLSKFINGRGGGQAFYSTCAGDNLEGIQKLFTAAKDLQIQFLK